MTNSVKYSVVIPTYNSAEFLEDSITSITTAFEQKKLDFELIIVDDFSSDATWDTIRHIKSNSSARVKGVRLSKNFGQHKATICGFNKA